MKNKRREFLKHTALSGIALAGSGILKGSAEINYIFSNTAAVENKNLDEQVLNVIGLYGGWAAALTENKLPSFSFRNKGFTNLDAWRKSARKRVMERMAVPDIGVTPKVNVNKQYSYDGLHVEELTWQLPYGRSTEAILLKPLNAKGRLPAILAFHDHGGNKYFGTRKITRTSDQQHPVMEAHQKEYYEGFAWANEIAKRGYVVLVPDAFPFASRRVMIQDVPVHLRQGLNDENPENPDNIRKQPNSPFKFRDGRGSAIKLPA